MTLAWKNPEAKHCRSCREAHQFENFLGRRKGAWQMGELSGMELLGGMWVYIPDWKRKNAVKTILFISILAECFCLACILKPRKETAHAIWIWMLDLPLHRTKIVSMFRKGWGAVGTTLCDSPVPRIFSSPWVGRRWKHWHVGYQEISMANMSFENANIAKQTFWQGTSLPIIRCTSPIAKKLATISCGSRTCWRIFFDSPCESSQSWKSQDERNQLTNVSVLATIETCSEQAIVESKIRTDSTWIAVQVIMPVWSKIPQLGTHQGSTNRSVVLHTDAYLRRWRWITA